jgi:hypothetical protein
VTEDQKGNLLLLIWRTWHLRNVVIFGKSTAMIVGSVDFLTSLKDSLGEVASRNLHLTTKGKEKIHENDPLIGAVQS